MIPLTCAVSVGELDEFGAARGSIFRDHPDKVEAARDMIAEVPAATPCVTAASGPPKSVLTATELRSSDVTGRPFTQCCHARSAAPLPAVTAVPHPYDF